MGEEMAEMMSEEITKVMEEQHNIEVEYARLVQQRDQLKGITNKHRLEETKREIMVSLTKPLQLLFKFKSNLSIFVYSKLPRSSRTALKSYVASFRKSPLLKGTSSRFASTRLTLFREQKIVLTKCSAT